jgi:hypothetical protein
MTCDWWSADEDSKHGGYCVMFDRDCSGTRDNDCCDIAIEDVENYKKLHMITPIKDWPKSVKPCGISSWCDNHPDAWVEMSLCADGIKFKMSTDLKNGIERKIFYIKVKHSRIDLLSAHLDDMYKTIVSSDSS